MWIAVSLSRVAVTPLPCFPSVVEFDGIVRMNESIVRDLQSNSRQQRSEQTSLGKLHASGENAGKHSMITDRCPPAASQLDSGPAVGDFIAVHKISTHLIIEMNCVYVLGLEWNRGTSILDTVKDVISDGIAPVRPRTARVPCTCIARFSAELGEIVSGKIRAVCATKHPRMRCTVHCIFLEQVANAVEIDAWLVHPLP